MSFARIKCAWKAATPHRTRTATHEREPDITPGGRCLLLGAYHGVNPGMGWLFAVALGMQEKNRRAVISSLLPLGLGHGLAIGAVVALAALAQVVVPVATLKIAADGDSIRLWSLLPFPQEGIRAGAACRWDFKDLTIWSFIMASAHGAGFMVLPVVLAMSAGGDAGHAHHGALQAAGMMAGADRRNDAPLAATIASHPGISRRGGACRRRRLRKARPLPPPHKAWINLDLIWSGVLIATGCFVLLI